MLNILYLGWVGSNNIGDELMLDNFKALAKRKLKQEYKISSTMCSDYFNKFDNYDVICLGGGSILMDGFINVINNALESGKKVVIWGSAYDDLHDIKFIDQIKEKNLAYLYSDITEEKLLRISKEALYFGVRGPITYSILQGSNIEMDKVILSGDPGFLLEEANIENPFNFTKKDKVVAVNVGTSLNRVYGSNEELVMQDMEKSVKKLIEKGYKIYLYSMWKNDIKIVIDFYKTLNDMKNVIIDMDIRSGSEVLSIIKNCIFTINFKLHANVISAVAGVPFVCICYRLKGYDFVDSLDLRNFCVSTDDKDINLKIDSIIEYIEENNDEISNKITQKVKYYNKILEASLDCLNDV